MKEQSLYQRQCYEKRCLRLGFANRVILAWGNHGTWQKQDLYTLYLLKNHTHLYSLGITKKGCPRHPLYLRKTTKS